MKHFIDSLSKCCVHICAIALIPITAITVLLIRAPKLLLRIFYYLLIALCSFTLVSLIVALAYWLVLKARRKAA